jgi:hypothetical protein
MIWLSIKDWVQNSPDLVTQLQNLNRALEAGRKEEAKQIKAKLPFLINMLENWQVIFKAQERMRKVLLKTKRFCPQP